MASVNLSHLEVIARRLIREHNLTVAPVVNPRKTLAWLKALPSKRKVKFTKGGGQQWGPDLVPEYNTMMKSHRADLDRDYPRERAWWPTAIHVLTTDFGATLDAEVPWLSWFEAILGQPYPDFPPELDWKHLIHQHWLDQSREWRFGWEARFIQQYPDAEYLDVLTVGQGGGNIWGEWRAAAYIHGFAWTEGLWEKEAFEQLAFAQRIVV